MAASSVPWRVWRRTWKVYRKNCKPKPKPTDLFPNFDAYGRNVNLYLSGAEFREFHSLVKALARTLGTRNQHDTVLAALRRLNRNHQVLRFVRR